MDLWIDAADLDNFFQFGHCGVLSKEATALLLPENRPRSDADIAQYRRRVQHAPLLKLVHLTTTSLPRLPAYVRMIRDTLRQQGLSPEPATWLPADSTWMPLRWGYCWTLRKDGDDVLDLSCRPAGTDAATFSDEWLDTVLDALPIQYEPRAIDGHGWRMERAMYHHHSGQVSPMLTLLQRILSRDPTLRCLGPAPARRTRLIT